MLLLSIRRRVSGLGTWESSKRVWCGRGVRCVDAVKEICAKLLLEMGRA